MILWIFILSRINFCLNQTEHDMKVSINTVTQTEHDLKMSADSVTHSFNVT